MEFKRLVLVAVVLLIVWGSFIWFLINYGNEIKDNPLAVATKKYDVDCYCSSPDKPGLFISATRNGEVTFHEGLNEFQR